VSYEEEELIKRSAPQWLSVLITLLIETGFRVRKEALPLKWANLHLDSEPAYLEVRDSKSPTEMRTTVAWVSAGI